jgi:hypothetical protein
VRDDIWSHRAAGRFVYLAATLLAVGCGSHQPRQLPPAIHADVADPIGDAQPVAGVRTPPDLVGVTADVVGNTMTVRVRFAPGTFDRDTTRITIQLDTDSTTTTGIQTRNGIGIDYIIDAWAPTRRGLVQRANPPPLGSGLPCNPCYVGTGSARVALEPDAMTVTARLSRMANPHGPMAFRVLAYAMRPGTRQAAPTAVADSLPDEALPPARVE